MATHSHGTTLTWNFNTVAELTNIGSPSMSASSIDITTHQSADRAMEFMAGLVDGGTISISGNFDYTDTDGQIAMLTDFSAGTTQAAIISLPNGIATWFLSAFITKYEISDAPVNDKLSFSADLKVTGLPSLVLATSAGLTTPFFAISESAVITPSPANDTYTYVATVLTGVTSVTVTPTATAGTITVNGSAVSTGVASSAIALGAAGSVTEITIVVTETGTAPKTYTIYLSRAAS